MIGFKIDTMRDIKDLIQFAKGIAVHYPLAVAAEDVKQKFGGIEGLPTTMIYDRQGILRSKVVGFEHTDNIESASKPLLVLFLPDSIGVPTASLRIGWGDETQNAVDAVLWNFSTVTARLFLAF